MQKERIQNEGGVIMNASHKLCNEINVLAAALILVICIERLQANTPMHDYQNEIHLIKMLSKAQESVTKLENIGFEIKQMNDILGSYDNNSVSFSYGKQISDYLLTASYASRDGLYALQHIIDMPLEHANWKSLSWNIKQISENLYPQSIKGQVEFEEIDRIHSNRKIVYEKATQSSIALAGTHQANIDRTHSVVHDLSTKVGTSSNVHDDLIKSNQILVLVADELIQIRHLLAKQLELTSSISLNLSGNTIGIASPTTKSR